MFWHEYTYNLKGQKISVAKYNAQGVQEQYLELTYDEEGRELTGYGYSTFDGNLFKCVTEYDGNNYHVTWYTGTDDTVSSYVEVEADAQGRVLKETEYFEDGSLMQTVAYEYDEAGNIGKRAYYDENNELTVYYIHSYDENGNCLQEQFYDGNGELTGYSEYVYDADGNLWEIAPMMRMGSLSLNM